MYLDEASAMVFAAHAQEVVSYSLANPGEPPQVWLARGYKVELQLPRLLHAVASSRHSYGALSAQAECLHGGLWQKRSQQHSIQ